jgi:two-component system chemotaxis response regulator CheB
MELLQDLPANFPLPILIVQHRSRDQQSLLEEVLQNKCKISIRQAEEKERIQPGIVFIAPPDYHLLIERDFTLSLSADEHVLYSRPSVDVLFESAAMAYADKLIAILLTGANIDGAAGIMRVRETGGLTIAQDPNEALFSAMPGGAIKTGMVNKIMNLAAIKNFLLMLSE